jgi:hypothetical protein
MSVIGSDGLSLLVGDGAGTETYNTLIGCSLTQLEISQKAHVTSPIAADAWQVQAGTSNRKVLIDCEAYATDDVSALRLRALAASGALGDFKLELRASESLQFSAYVTQYRETIGAGEIKKLQCRLESSGAASFV